MFMSSRGLPALVLIRLVLYVMPAWILLTAAAEVVCYSEDAVMCALAAC